MEKGEMIGVFEMSSDITKEIKIQKNMMQQEKLMSIGRLSAGIAHEINNPLTTIMTSSMLLQEDIDPTIPSTTSLRPSPKRPSGAGKSLKPAGFRPTEPAGPQNPEHQPDRYRHPVSGQ
ncbi:MAG: histidine kinase dimerization/phospho-acceptor domain-containing protein [Desulfobacterales bacterium]